MKNGVDRPCHRAESCCVEARVKKNNRVARVFVKHILEQPRNPNSLSSVTNPIWFFCLTSFSSDASMQVSFGLHNNMKIMTKLQILLTEQINNSNNIYMSMSHQKSQHDRGMEKGGICPGPGA